MSHMVLVKAEVDEVTKASAEKWLESQGIDPEEAIRMFYDEVIVCQGLPFGSRGGNLPEIWNAGACEEHSAVTIASVAGELQEAREEGTKMLGLLMEFKADRALKKAARKAARLSKAGLQESQAGTIGG